MLGDEISCARSATSDRRRKATPSKHIAQDAPQRLKKGRFPIDLQIASLMYAGVARSINNEVLIRVIAATAAKFTKIVFPRGKVKRDNTGDGKDFSGGLHGNSVYVERESAKRGR